MSDKQLKNFKHGGKETIENGRYKFRVVEIAVKDGKSGYAYVIPRVVVVNPCPQQGTHIELGFSMAPEAESFAFQWLTAMGLDEEMAVPMDDSDRLEVFLNKHCVGAVIAADIVKEKNPSGYDQNSVSPPWAVEASELSAEDTAGLGGSKGQGCPF